MFVLWVAIACIIYVAYSVFYFVIFLFVSDIITWLGVCIFLMYISLFVWLLFFVFEFNIRNLKKLICNMSSRTIQNFISTLRQRKDSWHFATMMHLFLHFSQCKYYFEFIMTYEEFRKQSSQEACSNRGYFISFHPCGSITSVSNSTTLNLLFYEA